MTNGAPPEPRDLLGQGTCGLAFTPLRNPGLLIKNSVYFLCKVCYTNTSVRRDGQTRADEKEKTQTFCGQIRPSTRRYRVKGDGAGRLGFLRFLEEALTQLTSVLGGSFAATLHIRSLEIHKVFLRLRCLICAKISRQAHLSITSSLPFAQTNCFERRI